MDKILQQAFCHWLHGYSYVKLTKSTIITSGSVSGPFQAAKLQRV